MDRSAYDRLVACARRRPPETAIVLGSGLGQVAERVVPLAACDFAQAPGLVPTSVPGHAGAIILGEWAGRGVLIFSGRLHFYEGHGRERIVNLVRLGAELGVRRLVVTNAAGGIRDDLVPGTLMAVQRHLDWTRSGPWHDGEGSGPACSAPLNARLQAAARELGFQLTEGVYAAVLGPNYETPAEIRALRALGADAVGMSVIREIEAGLALGLECAAINCITNRAAGLGDQPLKHEEVLANSRRQAERMGDLIESFL